MKKKSLSITVATLLALSLTSLVFAGPMGGGMMGNGGTGRGNGMGMGAGFQGQPPTQMTEQQQADWKTWQEKNLQLRKEYLGNLVKSGALTQEQVDARIKAMEARHAFRAKNGFVAPGAMSGVKLTDEQKADMKKMAEQRLSIQKENLGRMVSAGQITQAQADAKIEAMQQRINDRAENGFTGRGHGGPGKGMGGGPRF